MKLHYLALLTFTIFSTIPAQGQAPRVIERKVLSPLPEIDEALLKASEAADLSRMSELLERGANVNTSRNNSGNVTPIFLAIKAKSLSAVQLLIKNGADVNVKSYGAMGFDDTYFRHLNYTPLHYATALDQIEIMQTLYDSGVKLSDEATAEIFYVAALRQAVSAMQFLLQREKPQNRAANASISLPTAMFSGNLEMVKLLIGNGADTKSKSEALLVACERRNLDVAFTLLENGADPNVKEDYSRGYSKQSADSLGNSPLIMLLSNDWPRFDSIEDLPYYLPFVVEMRSPEDRAKVVAELPKMHADSQRERERVAALIRALIAKGARPDALSLGGYTALLMTIEKGDELFVQALLEGGARANFAPPPFPLPIRFLARNGQVAKFSASLATHFDGSMAPEVEQKLRARYETRDLSIAKLLLQHGADLKNSDNRMTLGEAVQNHNNQLALLLLQKGVDANTPVFPMTYVTPPSVRGLTMTRAQAAQQEKDIMQRWNADNPAPPTMTPLQIAASNGNLEMVRALLNAKANANARDAKGLNALGYLARAGRNFAIFAAEFNSASNEGGERAQYQVVKPLDAAIMARLSQEANATDSAIAQLLIANGAQVSAPDAKSKSPLLLASQSSDISIVKLLLKAGARVDQHVALFDLIQNGRRQKRAEFSLAKLQLDLTKSDRIALWKPNDSTSPQSETQIQAQKMRATAFEQRARLMKFWGEQDAQIATQLIQNGANLNDRNNAGLTPLMLAARLGQIEMVRALLKAGAKPNLTNRSGQTLATQIDKYGSRHTTLPVQQTATNDKYETQMSTASIANRALLILQTLSHEDQAIITLISVAN